MGPAFCCALQTTPYVRATLPADHLSHGGKSIEHSRDPICSANQRPSRSYAYVMSCHLRLMASLREWRRPIKLGLAAAGGPASFHMPLTYYYCLSRASTDLGKRGKGVRAWWSSQPRPHILSMTSMGGAQGLFPSSVWHHTNTIHDATCCRHQTPIVFPGLSSISVLHRNHHR